jgi:hypothetical protein
MSRQTGPSRQPRGGSTWTSPWRGTRTTVEAARRPATQGVACTEAGPGRGYDLVGDVARGSWS